MMQIPHFFLTKKDEIIAKKADIYQYYDQN